MSEIELLSRVFVIVDKCFSIQELSGITIAPREENGGVYIFVDGEKAFNITTDDSMLSALAYVTGFLDAIERC